MCPVLQGILVHATPSSCRDHFIIFSGGMPRASYGDRHCVSVLRAETLVTLDFTSRVIDFFTVHNTRPEDGAYSASLAQLAWCGFTLSSFAQFHRI